MTITYGYMWSRLKKRLTEAWDEDRARKSHEKRQLYAAVIQQSSSSTQFVEINNNYVGVGFLDAELREYLSYTFDEVEPGRLFLNEATHREFDDGCDKVKHGTTYIFKQDGSIMIVIEDFLTNTRLVKETQANASGNWEPYPKFGMYESIVRENR